MKTVCWLFQIDQNAREDFNLTSDGELNALKSLVLGKAQGEYEQLLACVGGGASGRGCCVFLIWLFFCLSLQARMTWTRTCSDWALWASPAASLWSVLTPSAL